MSHVFQKRRWFLSGPACSILLSLCYIFTAAVPAPFGYGYREWLPKSGTNWFDAIKYAHRHRFFQQPSWATPGRRHYAHLGGKLSGHYSDPSSGPPSTTVSGRDRLQRSGSSSRYPPERISAQRRAVTIGAALPDPNSALHHNPDHRIIRAGDNYDFCPFVSAL